MAFGTKSSMGGRDYQEDGIKVVLDFNELLPDDVDKSVPRAFFGCFDGHGGSACMEHVKVKLIENLVAALTSNPSGAAADALTAAYEATERQWFEAQAAKEKTDTSGSTAVACLLQGNELTCANVGDSRAVLYTSAKEALPLTNDHKPNRESERQRIEGVGAACEQKTRVTPKFLCLGGKTMNIGPCRVMPGGLAVARAFGDAKCKPARLLFSLLQTSTVA